MQWIFSLFQIFVAIFPIVENGIQIWNAIEIDDTKISIETVRQNLSLLNSGVYSK